MLEVHTWQPNANSGKPLLCLHEKGVPFTYHYVDMGKQRWAVAGPRRIAPARAGGIGTAGYGARSDHHGTGARTLGLKGKTG